MSTRVLVLAAWLLLAVFLAATVTVMLLPPGHRAAGCGPGMRLNEAEGYCAPSHR